MRRAQDTANRAWLAFEAVPSFLAADENTALSFELGHRDGRESGEDVMLRRVVVCTNPLLGSVLANIRVFNLRISRINTVLWMI